MNKLEQALNARYNKCSVKVNPELSKILICGTNRDDVWASVETKHSKATNLYKLINNSTYVEHALALLDIEYTYELARNKYKIQIAVDDYVEDRHEA